MGFCIHRGFWLMLIPVNSYLVPHWSTPPSSWKYIPLYVLEVGEGRELARRIRLYAMDSAFRTGHQKARKKSSERTYARAAGQALWFIYTAGVVPYGGRDQPETVFSRSRAGLGLQPGGAIFWELKIQQAFFFVHNIGIWLVPASGSVTKLRL